MKNNITELVFILDRSGSMSGLESDTIGGFNSLIEKQKQQDGECFVSTILFDNDSEVIHDRVRLAEVKPMTDRDYAVGGSTALIDAIGGAIRHIVFVITTDGMENASRRYDADRVRRMIEHEKEKYGWEFLFLAANIDAVTTARRFGIGADRAVNYHADRQGTGIIYDTVAEAVCEVRASRPLGAGWSARIDADYKGRKKK